MCVYVYVNVYVCIYIKFYFYSCCFYIVISYVIVISSKMTTVMYCICHHVVIKGDIAFLICCKKWVSGSEIMIVYSALYFTVK